MNLKRLNFSDFVFALISFSTLYILIYNIFFYSPILGYDGKLTITMSIIFQDICPMKSKYQAWKIQESFLALL